MASNLIVDLAAQLVFTGQASRAADILAINQLLGNDPELIGLAANILFMAERSGTPAESLVAEIKAVISTLDNAEASV